VIINCVPEEEGEKDDESGGKNHTSIISSGETLNEPPKEQDPENLDEKIPTLSNSQPKSSAASTSEAEDEQGSSSSKVLEPIFQAVEQVMGPTPERHIQGPSFLQDLSFAGHSFGYTNRLWWENMTQAIEDVYESSGIASLVKNITDTDIYQKCKTTIGHKYLTCN